MNRPVFPSSAVSAEAVSTPRVEPSYLREVYNWAYLTPWIAAIFDHQFVPETILWGNCTRLTNRVLARIRPGMRVMQPAAVYGVFSPRLAEAVGAEGHLEVRDVAPLQISRTRVKMAPYAQSTVVRHDAAEPTPGKFDAVACFFLLHEVPDDVKKRVTRAMLSNVEVGGEVIFVDYHGPKWWHPLKLFMLQVNRWLEPFAEAMWNHEVREYAGSAGDAFDWSKETIFGGLYQITVARRRERA